MATKQEYKVDRHQVQGETGAAAGEAPATAQEAIERATEAWPLFEMFHSAFGTVQRLRDDTWEETCSPFNAAQAAGARGAGAGPSRAPATGREASKRARAKWPQLGMGSSSEEDVQDLTEDFRAHECTPEGSAAAAGPSSSDPEGRSVKRSRRTARDMQLGGIVADGRMQVAEKTAELKQANSMKLAGFSMGKKEEQLDRLEKVQNSIADKHIAAAAADRDVQKEAVAVQRDALNEQKKHNMEKLQGAEILELMRMYVAGGSAPAEARRLARRDVLGEEGV